MSGIGKILSRWPLPKQTVPALKKKPHLLRKLTSGTGISGSIFTLSPDALTTRGGEYLTAEEFMKTQFKVRDIVTGALSPLPYIPVAQDSPFPGYLFPEGLMGSEYCKTLTEQLCHVMSVLEKEGFGPLDGEFLRCAGALCSGEMQAVLLPQFRFFTLLLRGHPVDLSMVMAREALRFKTPLLLDENGAYGKRRLVSLYRTPGFTVIRKLYAPLSLAHPGENFEVLYQEGIKTLFEKKEREAAEKIFTECLRLYPTDRFSEAMLELCRPGGPEIKIPGYRI